MAVVSPVPDATTQQASPLTLAGDMESGREIVAEPVARVIEDKIFVAVGKSVKEYKWMLIWALQNSGGKRICIVHVHQPSQTIPLSKFTKMKENEFGILLLFFCYYEYITLFFKANYR